MSSPVPLLIVPGLRDHVADHWQTLLARKLAPQRLVCSVPPLGRENLSCEKRIDGIQQSLEFLQGPVIVIAHSGGVISFVHWAQKYHRIGIVGALLAAPADLETPLPAGYPSVEELRNDRWLPVPRSKLPFRSLVAVSSNDPLAEQSRVEQFARDWGSECVHLGAVGHLNPAAGFGEWPQAEELIARFDRLA
ncbi:RBBP9/YdeN family alpha/beta hydrolase [Povalibacter sp.]|uniref:RBBP9/YdeN family alpha/beta hydrolase n=1 Tax=Povalibacter sp. TaxID=1962978 RepID=UPI002F42CA9B